jgi:hypothetical protein
MVLLHFQGNTRHPPGCVGGPVFTSCHSHLPVRTAASLTSTAPLEGVGGIIALLYPSAFRVVSCMTDQSSDAGLYRDYDD